MDQVVGRVISMSRLLGFTPFSATARPRSLTSVEIRSKMGCSPLKGLVFRAMAPKGRLSQVFIAPRSMPT